MLQNSISTFSDKLHVQRISVVSLLVLLFFISVIFGLAIGALSIPAKNTLYILLDYLNPFFSHSHDSVQQTVISDLRGPRVLLGALTGASLAIAGACFQSLFRNPLADPAVIGVSAGAATAAVFYIVVGQGVFIAMLGYAPLLGLPIAAIAGAMIAVLILYTFVNRREGIDVATLLLAGIALNAFCSAITGILVFLSDDQQLRELTFWTLGSLTRAQWETVLPMLVVMMIIMVILMLKGNALNAFSLGEADAFHLGYDVNKIKKGLIFFGAAAVGCAVALTGIIGFIGLVVPHIVRLLIGADNRYVLVASAILGAGLLITADIFARVIVQPAEMPIGIITSLIGAPFFMYLLTRRRLLG